MQVVVVTGHSSSSIETGWDIMRSLDVAAAAPSQIETEDPVVFHQKMFRARKVGPTDEPGQIKPGRLWQRLAENLLVNNVESDVWGWGDAQSSRLLDFWAGIDQSVHFVLLYVAPEVDLAMSLAVTDEQHKDPKGKLTSWRLKNSELLDFYSRNRDRCLLINTYALIRSPDRMGDLLTDRFGIELPSSVRNPIASIGYPISAMRSFLARTLLDDSDAIELYQELETASDLPADPDYARDEAETAWSEYMGLVDSHGQLQAVQSEAGETKRALEEAQHALDDARQANEEQTKENELLLVQLHQVQEELENYYLKYTESQQALLETPVTTAPASQNNKKPNGKNGHDTLADHRGFVRAYLNKRKTAKRLKRKIAVIKRSNLFDEQWYLKEYPDVAQSGMDPVRHYIKFGAEEGRDPSLAFDTRFYQQSNPDVNGSEVNPLIHYISQGKKEGRRVRP